MSTPLMTEVARSRQSQRHVEPDIGDRAENVSGLVEEILGYHGIKTSFDATTFHEESGDLEVHLGVGGHYAGLTPTLREMKRRSRTAKSLPPTIESRDPVQSEGEVRIQLLARRYVLNDAFSQEQAARLTIATERLRALLPAVGLAEIEYLEGAVARIDVLTAKANESRARLISILRPDD